MAALKQLIKVLKVRDVSFRVYGTSSESLECVFDLGGWMKQGNTHLMGTLCEAYHHLVRTAIIVR
jgi:hypothetical protein